MFIVKAASSLAPDHGPWYLCVRLEEPERIEVFWSLSPNIARRFSSPEEADTMLDTIQSMPPMLVGPNYTVVHADEEIILCS